MNASSDRAFAPELDQEAVRALLLDWRVAGHLDRYPTLWRLGVYLTSRLWKPERNAHVWLDQYRNIVGFALLWQRAADTRWRALERIIHPGLTTSSLAIEMREWAEERVRAITAEHMTALALGISACEDDEQALVEVRGAGYEASYGYSLYMARDLGDLLPMSSLPSGFSIRPLAGEHELAEYDALYDFTAVTPEHRRELLHAPEYLHLVAVAPGGRFVAYCECSYWRMEWECGGRRIAWIDYVGTHPDVQRQGLGAALLLAGMHWMQMHGAERAMLLTSSTNLEAQSLYEKLGFAVVLREVGFTKPFG